MKIAPILLIIYRRFDTASKVLDSIRPAKPSKLYLAANAPANESQAEIAAVQKARSIAELIDWECEVITLFRESHLKVRESVPSSISWFFSHEKAGIILEDDCVVAPDFLYFATEMLELYNGHPKVFQISACNVEGVSMALSSDYFFSKFPMIWGWATWGNIWKPYEKGGNKMDYWNFWRKLKGLFPNPIVRFYWVLSQFYTRSGKRETWDSLWTASVWERGGMTIVPKVNLVSNIGFGVDSTNTQSSTCKWAEMPMGKLPPPWDPPALDGYNLELDINILNQFYGAGRSWVFNVCKLLFFICLPIKLKKILKGFISRYLG